MPAETGFVGGWVETSIPGCVQTLVISPEGGFVHQVLAFLDGRSALSTLEGSWSGSGTAQPAVAASTLITPTREATPEQLAYCHQWLAGTRIDLPFNQVLQATGVDPLALTYRAWPVPGRGSLVLGSDGSDQDRFALHRDDAGLLRGYVPSDAGVPLYHREPKALLAKEPLSNGTLLHLPEQSYQAQFVNTVPGQELARRLLRVNTASDVSFTTHPDSVLPMCEFSVFDTLDYSTFRTPNPLAAANLALPVPMNPADPGHWFYTTAFNVDGVSEPAHLWPIAMFAPAGGGCSVNIRARPIALRGLEAQLALPPQDDPLAVPVGLTPAFILAFRPEIPGHWLPLSLAGGAHAWQGLKLTPGLIKPPLPGTGPAESLLDVLGLYGEGAVPVYITLTGQEDATRLSVFPDPGATYGMGPYDSYRPPVSALMLQLPVDVPQSFSPGESVLHYRFRLAAAERVAFSSSGGLDTAARLRDIQGRVLGEDYGGAVDGVGFHLARTLAPGEYTLEVLREGVTGTFQLQAGTAVPGLLNDEALEGCLIATGSQRLGASQVRRVNCAGRGVSDLGGLEAFSNITHLDLSENNIVDLTPLQGFPRLVSLALGDNPLGSLAPLGAVPRLWRLSLAHGSLDASQIAWLSTMGGQLTELDLTGVKGLDEAGAIALKGSLHNTTLTTPAGTVLD